MLNYEWSEPRAKSVTKMDWRPEWCGVQITSAVLETELVKVREPLQVLRCAVTKVTCSNICVPLYPAVASASCLLTTAQLQLIRQPTR